MPKRSFTDHKLSRVGSVQTVDAIRPRDSILHFQVFGLSATITKESRSRHYIFCDWFERTYNVLVSTRTPVRRLCPHSKGWSTSCLLDARLISHALYKIFLSSGKNWFRYVIALVYSSSRIDSRGVRSRDWCWSVGFLRSSMILITLTRFSTKRGAPYRSKRSSKWRAAAL